MGELNLERTLRLRRSALSPAFRDSIPERLFDPISSTLQGWPFDHQPSQSVFPPCLGGTTAPTSALFDLLEYLAIRTAPIPLSGILDLLRSLVGKHTQPWDVVQTLRDAGVLKVFGMRGWRGNVVLTRGPQCALVRSSVGWSLRVEGCVSETWVARFEATASQFGLPVEHIYGVGAWSPPTLMVRSPDIPVLTEIANLLEAPVSFLVPDLRAIKSIFKSKPTEMAPKQARRQLIELSKKHAPLAFLETQVANQAPFWEVNTAEQARYWRTREDAVLDAYLAVGERPFEVSDGRLVARHARLPDHVARWVRLVSGVAAGPVGDAYGYACNTDILRELACVEPGFFSEREPLAAALPLPLSRRWSQRAVATTNGPRIVAAWVASRLAREGE
jgi:hypothetical protein